MLKTKQSSSNHPQVLLFVNFLQYQVNLKIRYYMAHATEHSVTVWEGCGTFRVWGVAGGSSPRGGPRGNSLQVPAGPLPPDCRCDVPAPHGSPPQIHPAFPTMADVSPQTMSQIQQQTFQSGNSWGLDPTQRAGTTEECSEGETDGPPREEHSSWPPTKWSALNTHAWVTLYRPGASWSKYPDTTESARDQVSPVDWSQGSPGKPTLPSPVCILCFYSKTRVGQCLQNYTQLLRTTTIVSAISPGHSVPGSKYRQCFK